MSRSRLAPPVALALALATSGPGLAQPAGPQMPPAPPPMTGPATPQPLQPGDAFGEEVTLAPRTIIYLKGHTNWDAAFATLVEAFKSLHDYLDRQDIKPTGPAMTIYTETDDTGFRFKAALPVAEAPKDAPKGDIATGPSPAGKALKFIHRGSYDAMDSTYEAITNYLDDRRLEAKDLFIEEYATDPVMANADRLVITVFVPIK
jgi:effector-binding domain-containing protein